MFRKFTVALTATAIIAGAALAPTAASAKWWKHHHHGLGAAIVVGSAILASQVQQCPLIKQYYVNKWGHVRVRYVQACY